MLGQRTLAAGHRLAHAARGNRPITRFPWIRSTLLLLAAAPALSAAPHLLRDFNRVGDVVVTGADDGLHGREPSAIPLADIVRR